MFNMQFSNPHNVNVTIYIYSPLSQLISEQHSYILFFQGKVILFCFVSWLGLAVNTRVSPDEGKTISSWDEMIKWVPGMRVKISYTALLSSYPAQQSSQFIRIISSFSKVLPSVSVILETLLQGRGRRMKYIYHGKLIEELSSWTCTATVARLHRQVNYMLWSKGPKS